MYLHQFLLFVIIGNLAHVFMVLAVVAQIMAAGEYGLHIFGIAVNPSPVMKKGRMYVMFGQYLQYFLRILISPGGIEGKGHLFIIRFHTVYGSSFPLIVLETETAWGTKVVTHLTKATTPRRKRADLITWLRRLVLKSSASPEPFILHCMRWINLLTYAAPGKSIIVTIYAGDNRGYADCYPQTSYNFLFGFQVVQA